LRFNHTGTLTSLNHGIHVLITESRIGFTTANSVVQFAAAPLSLDRDHGYVLALLCHAAIKIVLIVYFV
jgi:uncharacterized membrane protein